MVVEPARLSKNGSGNNHVEDHPLNPNPESQWGSFFKDNEVLAQIDKDVRLVYCVMGFMSFFFYVREETCQGQQKEKMSRIRSNTK